MAKFKVQGYIHQSFEIEVEARDALDALVLVEQWEVPGFDDLVVLKDRSIELNSAEEIVDD